MTATSQIRTVSLRYLITLIMALILTACSTSEDFSSTPSSSDGTTGVTGTTGDTGVTGVTTIALTWAAPSERGDGTALALSEIAGYRIYYGTSQGSYPLSVDILDKAADQAELNNLESGTYYVVVTTIDSDGRESTYSDELSQTI